MRPHDCGNNYDLCKQTKAFRMHKIQLITQPNV